MTLGLALASRSNLLTSACNSRHQFSHIFSAYFTDDCHAIYGQWPPWAPKRSAFKPNVTISVSGVECRISCLPMERGQMKQTDAVSIDLALQMRAKNDGSKQNIGHLWAKSLDPLGICKLHLFKSNRYNHRWSCVEIWHLA